MTGEQKPGGLEVVAKVVSAFGDPEAFGEREIEVVADLSRIPYETRLTPAEPAEARIRELVERVGQLQADFDDCNLHRAAAVQRATAAEAKLARAVEGLEAIKALSSALRQGGPDPSDLEDLSDNLEAAVDVAAEVLAALQQEGE